VQECLLKAYRGFDGLRDDAGGAGLVPPDPAQLRPRPLPPRTRACPREEPVDPLRGLLAVPQDRRGGPLALLRQRAPRLPALVLPGRRVAGPRPDQAHVPGAPLVLVHMEGHSTRQVARMFGVPRTPCCRGCTAAASSSSASCGSTPPSTTCSPTREGGLQRDHLRGGGAPAVGVPRGGPRRRRPRAVSRSTSRCAAAAAVRPSSPTRCATCCARPPAPSCRPTSRAGSSVFLDELEQEAP
jgi:hypothetical protein